MPTPLQIELVRVTWRQAQARQGQLARIFYDHLFSQAPDVRPMFRRDPAEQAAMLGAALDAVVAGLDDLGTLLPAVQALARRHVGYGVRPAHYDAVGRALLSTLSSVLGDDITVDAHAAWQAAYTALATAMKQAAYGEREA